MLSLSAVVLVLVVLTAWNSLALLGLYKRLLAVERRLVLKDAVQFPMHLGDPVPSPLAVSTRAEQTELHLDRGEWLVSVLSSGCSACGRALEAANAFSGRVPSLQAVAFLPSRDLDDPAPQPTWLHEEGRNQDGLYFLAEREWSWWKTSATPTLVLIRHGRILDATVGATTEEAIDEFYHAALPDSLLVPTDDRGPN